MKHLRKSILTLLALTLFGGAGAWAQNTVTWTQADLSGINLESGQSTTISGVTLTANNGRVYMDNVPALFFEGNNVEGFTFSVAEGSITQIVITASMFNVSAAGWTMGETQVTWTGNAQSVNVGALVYDVSSIEFTLSGGNSSGVELTKSGANQWTLGQTPDYDLELQVEYYQKYALKDIPAGWTVMVNGQDSTSRIVGDSLLITETDTVTLVPPAELKNAIKSVTLEDDVQTLTIGSEYGNFPITYTPGETWRQAIQNHAENANADWDVWGTPEKVWLGEMKLYSMTGDVWSLVDPDTAISSSTQYKLAW